MSFRIMLCVAALAGGLVGCGGAKHPAHPPKPHHTLGEGFVQPNSFSVQKSSSSQTVTVQPAHK